MIYIYVGLIVTLPFEDICVKNRGYRYNFENDQLYDAMQAVTSVSGGAHYINWLPAEQKCNVSLMR